MESGLRRKLPAAVQQMLAHEAELEGMRMRHQVCAGCLHIAHMYASQTCLKLTASCDQ